MGGRTARGFFFPANKGGRLREFESGVLVVLLLIETLAAQVLVDYFAVYDLCVADGGEIFMAVLTMHGVPLMTWLVTTVIIALDRERVYPGARFSRLSVDKYLAFFWFNHTLLGIDYTWTELVGIV